MKKLIALALIGLGGCAQLSTLTSLSGGTVSPSAMIVAANSFDAVEATATNYIGYCRPTPKPLGCSLVAIQKMIPVIRSGRIARNNLEAFVAANPGKLGTTGLYNALTTVTQTLSQIEAQYNVTAVHS